MKAVRVNQWAQPVQIEDIPQPEPADDEVLVRVHAASLNPFDSWVHMGWLQAYISAPLTLGADFAGEVVKTGPQIEHVKPGDAVYGLRTMNPGAFAEYVVAKANEVTLKPQSLSYIQAAATPLASLAAYQSLFDLGQPQAGERVLILGAAGAVGSCAIQLAKSVGAQVFAVDVPARAGFVQALGPERFIDANAERFEDVVGTVDLVLDYIGGEYLQRSLTVLPSGGRYVTSLLLPPTVEAAEQKGIKTAALGTQPRADQLDEIAHRIDAGQLQVFVNCTFPLQEAQAAIEYRATAADPGKIVLTLI